MTDDETFATPDEALAAATAALVEDLGCRARACGWDEARFARMQALLRQLLRGRHETMRQMLEHRCTAVH